MKKRIYQYTLLCAALLFAGACSDSFLEPDPRGLDPESDYYRNRDEAFKGLVAVYDVVGYMSSGLVTKVGAVNSASDDHFAGGGTSTDMNVYQVWSNHTLTPAVGPQDDLWRKGYAGISRANFLLSKLPTVPMDDTEKARFVAEAKFLRAYFYFDLVRFFKNIPLILEPLAITTMNNVEQATPAAVYAQIEKDINESLANLPDKVTGADAARANRGMAYALLGKVYLYEEKFADAATALAKVNGTTPGQPSEVYGYDLLDNYGDLFKTSNEFNSESIFEISFTNSSAGDWGCSACTEGNILAVMAGPRTFSVKKGFETQVPAYVSGWSFFVITPNLVAAMTGDPRYVHTIADIKGLKDQDKVNYEPGYMDTGYFLEKFAAKQSDRSTGAGAADLNYPHNIYEIRLADTYLMEAEALVRGSGSITRAQQLLDAVRARVGLGPVAATYDNILAERRLELAGEGHRWFDVVRTGRAATALAFKGFQAGKHEILPVPILELENTKIQQSKEYGGTK